MMTRESLENILFSGDDYFLIKKGVDALYDQWSAQTGILAGDLTNEKMRETQHGKVVTPVHAAHCVKDLARTAKFLRGIHKAIEHYLKTNAEVRILYAGCGPYSTLLIPFTLFYAPDQIRFTLLDIEKISLNVVEKLYFDWKLESYIENIIEADATSPDLSFSCPFDIIISETMQVALRNECQVPITRNLVRFLNPLGTFIPERIALEIFLTGTLDPMNPKNQEKKYLGTAYNLDFRNVPSPNHKTLVEMKDSELNFLQLFTEIHLFGGERLTVRQSGLTIPLTLDRFSKRKPSAIEFTYKEGPKPELLFEYLHPD